MCIVRATCVVLTVSWMFAVHTFASTLSFQPTSFNSPVASLSVPANALYPLSWQSTNPPAYFYVPLEDQRGWNAIDLTSSGITTLSQFNLPSFVIPSEGGTIYPATNNSFSVQGVIQSSSGGPDFPITLNGLGSGAIWLSGSSPGTWSGSFTGTVNSVTFPTGMPESEIQYLTNMLGDLSRFRINGTVDSQFSNPAVLTVTLDVSPYETPVPEPSVLAFMVLSSSALVLRSYHDRKKSPRREPGTNRR